MNPSSKDIPSTDIITEEADEENHENMIKKETKETLASADDQKKKTYQAQIEKLAILKGVGSKNSTPCVKEQGYLSIEAFDLDVWCIVMRTFAGRTLF